MVIFAPKIGQFRGSKEISVWLYFKAEGPKLVKTIQIWIDLRKNCKIGKKKFFRLFSGGFRQNWRFSENLAKILKLDLLLQKWCWEAQLWLKTNYGSFLKNGQKAK